jgi:hypothetical protein
MATTSYGTTYVQSSDLVSAYPTASSSLATRIDEISFKGNGINAQTGTSYSLVLLDGGKNVTLSNASAVNVTVPLNSSQAFATGTVIGLANLGAGTVTVAGAVGVTVNGSSLTLAQYDAATLIKTGTDTWLMVKGGGLPKASYSATTGSPTITTVSGKTCIQFTGSGSITISTAGTVEALIVGGGAAPGNWSAATYGGGGGAGGYYYTTTAYLPTGTYTVSVAAGGAGSTTVAGSPGGLSYIGGTSLAHIVATGGGQGGGASGVGNGSPGASGGGSGGNAAYNAGTTNLPIQGNNGGGTSGVGGYGGGGGGSASAGTSGTASVAGSGGNGTANSITGSSITYAVGGNATGGTNGTTNRGNGGSAAYGSNVAVNGGSGIVILLIG